MLALIRAASVAHPAAPPDYASLLSAHTDLQARHTRLIRLRGIEQEFEHAMLTAVMVWWTFCLVTPYGSFYQSVTHRVFAELAPKWVWALVFGSAAAIGTWGVLSRKHDGAAKVLSASYLSFSHLFVALLMIASTRSSTGIGAYSGLAAIGFLLVWMRVYAPSR